MRVLPRTMASEYTHLRASARSRIADRHVSCLHASQCAKQTSRKRRKTALTAFDPSPLVPSNGWMLPVGRLVVVSEESAAEQERGAEECEEEADDRKRSDGRGRFSSRHAGERIQGICCQTQSGMMQKSESVKKYHRLFLRGTTRRPPSLYKKEPHRMGRSRRRGRGDIVIGASGHLPILVVSKASERLGRPRGRSRRGSDGHLPRQVTVRSLRDRQEKSSPHRPPRPLLVSSDHRALRDSAGHCSPIDARLTDQSVPGVNDEC